MMAPERAFRSACVSTQALDPKKDLPRVYTGDRDTEEEALRPFLWRFAVHAPAAGRIAIYDTSWYRGVQADRFEGILKEKRGAMPSV